MYFFTRRRRASSNGSKRFSRTVDEGGLWDGHAAGKAIHKAGNGGEKIEIGHRAQLAFKLFDDKKSKKSTLWILHEYRLVDDKADDVVLCRIHKRKGKDEDEEEVAPVFINTQQTADEQTSLPAAQPLVEADAVAAADVDDDDLSLVRLLEEELVEVEVEEQRRVKRQRIGGGGGGGAHQIPMNQGLLRSPMDKRCAKRQRIEQEEAHQASAVDADDGLTMTLDEINTILDELPSNTSQQQPADPVDVEQLLKCLEVEPSTSFDGLSFCLDGHILQETPSPAEGERSVKGGEEIMSAMQDCLNMPLPAYAVGDEYCYDLLALGIC
ncbi:uncharacterized protein A4U43_C08F1160 [Asparagus officinalis]|nr:uncharacterized protein LOC109819426 [Asparagus officinalis]XP_020240744.1 uncharacterized protein LOC109819429 [Asparagus officinalis]ONK58926.1 uncharacterized protein A4U43_C08F1160 [Asparagus officinalis]